MSEREGLPRSEWCYEPNAEGKYADGMKLAANYLKRTGYRLPTEAEWEYAVRAGAVTSRHYGETEELLVKYACYLRNSYGQQALPVRSLKPNDVGLFDGHGNIWNWCQERYKSYGKAPPGGVVEDTEDSLVVNNEVARSLRGGSFGYRAEKLRCAERGFSWSHARSSDFGFRLARTFR